MTKCVILAGRRGTRISEESHLRPKPMIEIGARPILWHIMKGYAAYGVTEFIICLGYRGYMIKEYFANYFLHSSDVTINVALNTVSYHDSRSEPWEVTLVDTGEATLTGGRILRIRRYLDTDEPFYLTYGDGLADIDFAAQLDFHRRHGRLATMTVVRPPARFGGSMVEGDRIVAFEEKSQASTGLINGGAEGGRNEQTPREHVPPREYRAGERTGHVRRRAGVDVWEAIDAASTKPFGFMTFTPGPGSRRPLPAVDPSYLSWRVKQAIGANYASSRNLSFDGNRCPEEGANAAITMNLREPFLTRLMPSSLMRISPGQAELHAERYRS